jgi:uncharacterized protein (TIGR02246 family)
MKILSTAFSMLAVLALAACAPVAEEPATQETGPSVEADVAAIEQALRGDEAAVAAGDLEAWLSLFAEDIVLMPPNEPTVAGKDAVRAENLPLFEGFDMRETLSAEEIEVAGDWAFAVTTFSFEATPKEGGETTTETGRIMWIMRRQPDGGWRAARVIWNSDSPPAEE